MSSDRIEAISNQLDHRVGARAARGRLGQRRHALHLARQRVARLEALALLGAGELLDELRDGRHAEAEEERGLLLRAPLRKGGRADVQQLAPPRLVKGGRRVGGKGWGWG